MGPGKVFVAKLYDRFPSLPAGRAPPQSDGGDYLFLFSGVVYCAAAFKSGGGTTYVV